jgi:excisionase family DNA binding protein
MTERLAYTPREACEALRIGRTKLYELLAEGQLKAVALGGKTLLLREEIEQFVASLPPLPLHRVAMQDLPATPPPFRPS